MSITETSIYKCESCGHLIERGRLICKNCGAAAPIQEIISDINFYENVCPYDAFKYKMALTYLDEWAVLADRFIASGLLGEVHISDFLAYWIALTEKKLRGYGSHLEWNQEFRKNVKLFKTYIPIDNELKFYRYVAIDDGIAYICEINEKAWECISDMNFEYDRQRDIKYIENKIKELKNVITSELENLRKNQIVLNEINSQIEERNKKSFIYKMKNKKPNVTELLKSIDRIKIFLADKKKCLSEEEEKLRRIQE
jgi:hypothetical protein